MRNSPEDDAENTLYLLERADKLIQLLEARPTDRGVDVKVDNRVDNRSSERAAWVAGIAAAVAMTIAILQAVQIYALQAKYDRMQDYLNYIYQQAPSLRKPESPK